MLNLEWHSGKVKNQMFQIALFEKENCYKSFWHTLSEKLWVNQPQLDERINLAPGRSESKRASIL